MHFFKATLITFLYVACISAAPIDEPIGDVAAVDQVLKAHGLGDVVDTLPSDPSSAVAMSAAEIAVAERTTLTCEAYIDEHQPEPASTLADLRVVPINVSFLNIFELQGTIDLSNFVIQATLFVRVPFLGRVKVISFGGNLRNGIKIPVNTFIANGVIEIRLANGKDVILTVDLNVKIVGKVKGSVKLFTLPFAPETTLPNVD